MKKTLIVSFALLAMVFVACESGAEVETVETEAIDSAIVESAIEQEPVFDVVEDTAVVEVTTVVE